ncbi:MAG TPA: class I SAM-dependent methyltransferase [Gemmataceae bacterium]|nr:class I SAM-dependent methyltransferase [Gemmataceae bacterium]
MSATDRQSSERIFHDLQAQQRAVTFDRRPEALAFEDDAYLDHETWIRPAFMRLGEVGGLDILDYGCGHAMAAVVLARRGARLTAFDLSPGYLDEARRRAAANEVGIDFVQADGERLPFADGSFDRIWGNAVLHHLDVRIAGRELFRVLKPGGFALFCEPWGENPLLNWARQGLPYPGKARTPDEQPLRQRQVAVLREIFPSVGVTGCQLLAMARRVVKLGPVIDYLDRCDTMLLAQFPALRRYCRYVILQLQR